MDQQQLLRKRAYSLVLLFGFVSFFGDVTYEGARSIFGPYLQTLGASVVAVGIAAGVGEFVGYALRLLSGFLAQKTHRYWFFTFMGYGLIAAIPLAGFFSQWQTVAAFFILERLGKAIRTPARDTILSYATAPVGRGWGFALHEAVDQIGAIVGPLLFTFFLAQNFSYQQTLQWMFLPFLLLVGALFVAWRHSPSPQFYEERAEQKKVTAHSLPLLRWYLAFVFFAAFGFIQYPLIAYHLESYRIVSPSWIAGFYAIAMGIDSISALGFGKLYDRFSLRILLFIPLFSALLAVGAFALSIPLILLAVVAWGMSMGLQETVLRAFLADILPPHQRAFAYGVFTTVYGLGMFAAGAAIAALYQYAREWVLPMVLFLQLLAFACWWKLSVQLREIDTF